jgi:predicted signal transduction protein with EAL and GGDEF domain
LGSDAEDAINALKMIADKLHRCISEPVNLNGITQSTPSSIGITLFSHKTQGVNELLKEADLALYQAKAEGRNAIRFFDDEMHTQFVEKTNLEGRLRRALDKDELSLAYQPQVDQSGKIIGAEALLL